jgi:hypothetical protein
MELEFGPGEEKIALAFEHIAALQTQLLRLAQREEVDAMFTGVLLAHGAASQDLLERWQAIAASYYPGKALGHLGAGEHLEPAAAELKHRLDFWTRAIEARLQRES